MSKDLNKVQLTGRLGADPEMRFTPQGSAVTTFRCASNRTWKTADGQAREDTEWFSIVAWNKLAEICNEYLRKGSRVYIEGRLQTRSWDDQNTGEKRYKTEVIASDLIILDAKREGTAYPQADDIDDDYEAPAEEPAVAAKPAQARAPQAAPAQPPARQPAQAARPARKPVVMEEEDLPF